MPWHHSLPILPSNLLDHSVIGTCLETNKANGIEITALQAWPSSAYKSSFTCTHLHISSSHLRRPSASAKATQLGGWGRLDFLPWYPPPDKLRLTSFCLLLVSGTHLARALEFGPGLSASPAQQKQGSFRASSVRREETLNRSSNFFPKSLFPNSQELPLCPQGDSG